MKLHSCKACPQCQSPAPLTASQCLRCGHAYRTLFVAPAPLSPPKNPTRKIYALPASGQIGPLQTTALLASTILFIGGINVALQMLPHSKAPVYHHHDIVRKHLKPHGVKEVVVAEGTSMGKNKK